MILTWFVRGRPDVEMTLKGVLCGLVSSSGGVAIFSPLSASLIGGVSGVILYFSLKMMERVKIDDPVGAISIHGINGIWGTLAVGLFAQDLYGRINPEHAVNGLFFGGGIGLLAIQALAVLTVFLWAFPLSYGFFRLLEATFGLRVSPEEEVRGLDHGEYGLSSYPAFEEFRKKQDEILEELERVRELSLLRDVGQSVHTLNLDEILELILQGVAAGIAGAVALLSEPGRADAKKNSPNSRNSVPAGCARLMGVLCLSSVKRDWVNRASQQNSYGRSVNAS